MSHIPDEEWVDYVRGLASPERAAGIAAHLNEGCAQCARAHELWYAIAETAGRELLYSPPDAIVRRLSSAFEDSITAREPAPLWASLIFDSVREAHAAGARSVAHPSRRLLYAAGALSVDLAIEPGRPSTQVILIGQVASNEAGAPVAECAVRVLQEHTTLAEARTDSLGEFEFEIANHEQLTLVIAAQHQPRFLVQLPNVLIEDH
jgi:hypothetical protein